MCRQVLCSEVMVDGGCRPAGRGGHPIPIPVLTAAGARLFEGHSIPMSVPAAAGARY